MRELHAAWHEHGGRHRRGHDAIAPADIRLARAQDSPQPEARDSPGTGDQRQAAPEQPRPQQAKPDHAPAEPRDKPAERIASRDLSEGKEEARRQKPERSWLPSNETSQVVVALDGLFTTVNASCHILPGKVDGIAAAALGVVVAGVAWANKRWKDKYGDRPES
jgi:hypothetical protein